jgi:hypothetical protein
MKESLGLVLLILGIVVLFRFLAPLLALLVPGLGPVFVPVIGLLMIFLGGLLLWANKPKN